MAIKYNGIDVAQVAAQFSLTQREQETVGFLVEGLTTKEIAQRMHISPHTVKAFIRLVMIKMDVATRAGVIGKIVETVSKGDEDRGAMQL